MLEFEITINGRKTRAAKAAKNGLLTAVISRARYGDETAAHQAAALQVSDSDSETQKRRVQLNRGLRAGDEIIIRIIDAPESPRPRKKAARKSGKL